MITIRTVDIIWYYYSLRILNQVSYLIKLLDEYIDIVNLRKYDVRLSFN